jgi:hypothetical protein
LQAVARAFQKKLPSRIQGKKCLEAFRPKKDKLMPRVALEGRTSHSIKGVAHHDHVIGHLGVPHGFTLFFLTRF